MGGLIQSLHTYLLVIYAGQGTGGPMRIAARSSCCPNTVWVHCVLVIQITGAARSSCCPNTVWVHCVLVIQITGSGYYRSRGDCLKQVHRVQGDCRERG